VLHRPRAALAELRRHPLVVDTITAVALTWVGLLSVRTAIDAGGDALDPPPTAVWVGLTIALMMPLALRRRAPLVTLLVVTGVFFPYRSVDVPDLSVSVVAWWLALYSAGAYSTSRWRDAVRAANVICTLGYVAYRLATPDGELATGATLARAGFLFMLNALFIIAAWTYGDAAAARRAGELALADQAVALERVRIARELHDVVAHHVSVMGIQATAAARVMGHDERSARDALAAIERTSRTAIGELQRLLAFLRPAGDPAHDDRAPVATLRQLDQLVADVRAAGVGVDLVVRGAIEDLPDSVDVSAYRIIQEALTNVIKHADASSAAVTVERTNGLVSIMVINDGTDSAVARSGRGHGLIGMRERVGLHGGTIEAGPNAHGGFRVSATLPVRGPQ
jgi:signal transduction histidine kinase